MSSAHKHEYPQLSILERIDQARAIVEGANERFTPLRAHVLELIIKDGRAVKAYDLLDRLSPDVGSPKPPTVYRALEFLSRHGLIHRVEALNAFIACDHNHLHDHAHDHGDGSHRHLAEFFVCEKCHAVEERHAHDHIECKPEGFSITRSVVEHYGICASCPG
jgi:Fur family zinc uptake transcriptional regulator